MNTNILSEQPNISSFIEWHHTDNCQIPDVDNTIPGKIGILHIDIPPMPVCTGTLAVMFNLDKSGSMDDICSDSSTKIQHIQHALKNMLRVFIKTVETEPNLTIRIAVCVFSHNAHNLFNIVTDVSGAITCDEHGFITINSDNIQSILKKIDTIDPWGLTNIEKSLKYTQISLEDYHAANPEHRLIHIQFTDGNATVGKKSHQELTEYTDPSYKHIFIGIGDFHDSYLLTNLSQNLCLGEYRFIDQLENSGMICGEILYDILHPFLYPNHPVQIITNRGVKIYDWRINQWTTCLNLPSFSGNRSKDFQLCCNSDKTGDANIHIYCLVEDKDILLDTACVLPDLLDIDHTPIPTDLTIYILRQYTQEYLYEAVQHELSFRSDICLLQRDNYRDRNTEDSSVHIRKKLESFLQILETYQTRSVTKSPAELVVLGGRSPLCEGLLWLRQSSDQTIEKYEKDRHFIQVLKDDIIVTLKNMNTQFGFMYTNSRQTSQGNQYSYVPTGERHAEEEEYLANNTASDFRMERNISTNINHDIFNMMTQVQDTETSCESNATTTLLQVSVSPPYVLTREDNRRFGPSGENPFPPPIRRGSNYTFADPHFVFPTQEIN